MKMNKFYVSGVVGDGKERERTTDEEAQFFTVYERQADDTSQAICDCTNRESAGLAAERLNDLVERITELTCAMQIASDPQLWCERDDMIFQYRGEIWYADILKQALCKESGNA
jgi:hypothetical protein